MRVLESFPTPRRTTNPYITQLARGLAEVATVLTFAWHRAILGRYDLFHVHWPELMLRGTSTPKTWARRTLTAIFLFRLTVARTPVVRTVHNVDTHEAGDRFERLLLAWIDRLTVANVLLNPATPRRSPSDRVIAHSHYRAWYEEFAVVPRVPGRLAFVGLIRPYKGVPDLIAAFSGVDRPWSLHVAGSPGTAELGAEIRALASADQRVSLELTYLDEAAMAREISEATLVVLPYREIHNSGAALLALSLDRPVLVPDGEPTRLLADEVGHRWVQVFEPPLRAEDLVRAHDAVAGLAHADRPDLSGRAWDAAVSAHLELFEAVARRRRTRHRA